MSPNQKEFLKHVQSVAYKNDIQIKFLDVKYINEGKGVSYSGYFDDSAKTLVVATKRKIEDWFPVFVHEVCHMDQYLEKSKVWNTHIKGFHEKHDPMTLYTLHVDRLITLDPSIVNEVFSKVLNVELDCEKRAVKKIKKFDLDLDVNKYTRHANVCLFDYSYQFQNRKWYALRKITRHPAKVIDIAPEKLYNDPLDYLVIPDNIRSIFDEVVNGNGSKVETI
jgi:hypothetical protein